MTTTPLIAAPERNMSGDALRALLDRLPDLHIGVIGDFCLDAYWTVDMSRATRSLETGLMTRPVRTQVYHPGGAGNVLYNLLSLRVGQTSVFGVVGDEPFGWELRRRLDQPRVRTSGLMVQTGKWDTPVYLKPIEDGAEAARMDLGAYNQLANDVAQQVLEELERTLPEIHLVIINQQWPGGLHTPFFRERINEIIRQHPQCNFLSDCRDANVSYDQCVHKINEFEAARLTGQDIQLGDRISRQDSVAAAEKLYQRWMSPVFITRGARGCLVMDSCGLHEAPGLHIVKRTDPVGAGDSMCAGIAAGLAAGATAYESALFGNFVAGVTVQKLFQTGVASPEEILAIGSSPDYIYNPEYALDPRSADALENEGLEVIEPQVRPLRITHAIFDHDGTISTLRQGWEDVMHGVMLKIILGPQYAEVDQNTCERVTRRIEEFIDKTTGIQTLVQMYGLVELVKEFGFVPANEVQTPEAYKEVYNDALMNMVRKRMQRIQSGELDVTDFTIKNAPEFLARLHASGVALYMASGTDVQDVKDEAEVLGYGPFFERRIYGAMGDVTQEAKRQVLENILRDVGPENAGALVTFGDGPVELRETRKRGGFSVGLASDEVRRFGANPAKRARLIHAGAHVLIPDFSRMDVLCEKLGVPR
jgi:bifunctional ADP-heptose synthase (sugar kinase/adenylyltransferase)/phosphoglycolate phosphatase-like HAD superfamily hydrolase